MASAVKVKIERKKIIDALEAKKKELEATPAGALNETEQKMVLLLRETATQIEEGKNPWNSRGYAKGSLQEFFELWEHVRYEDRNYDSRGRPVPREEPPLVRIERQLKVLGLSDDEYVTVGVSDELYELL